MNQLRLFPEPQPKSLVVDDSDMSNNSSHGIINPDEAPIGFYAVAKSAYSGRDNICNYCDWRQQCCDESTDLLAWGNRCMPHQVVAYRDGKNIPAAGWM